MCENRFFQFYDVDEGRHIVEIASAYNYPEGSSVVFGDGVGPWDGSWQVVKPPVQSVIGVGHERCIVMLSRVGDGEDRPWSPDDFEQPLAPEGPGG